MTSFHDELTDSQMLGARRAVRLLSILRCAHDSGLQPVPGSAVHTIAYLADALSPVWGLPFLDAQVLKQVTRPNFPALQRDLDELVGRGIVRVDEIAIADRHDDNWSTRASFSLTALAEPALARMRESNYFKRQFEFVREVTFAAAGLGPEGLAGVGTVDASYADPFADVGSVIELAEPSVSGQTSAVIAGKFRDLAPDAGLTDAQLVHLYLRHLYSRLRVA